MGPRARPDWYRLNALLIACALSRRSILLEKTPRHVTRIKLIRSHMPATTFILTVRDGRDVVASLAERYGNFDQAFSRWLADTRCVLEEHRSSQSLLWKYEDFVSDPEDRLRRLCTQLAIPFEDAMLRFHEKAPPARKSETNAHSIRRNAQLRQPIYDGSGRWKTLTSAQLAAFETGEAAELQEAFGYPPSHK